MHRLTRLSDGFSKIVEDPAGDGEPILHDDNVGFWCGTHSAWRRQWGRDSPTMSGPSKNSSLSSGERDPETLLAYIERIRLEAEELHRTLEQEIQTTLRLIEDLRVRQAKRRHRDT